MLIVVRTFWYRQTVIKFKTEGPLMSPMECPGLALGGGGFYRFFDGLLSVTLMPKHDNQPVSKTNHLITSRLLVIRKLSFVGFDAPICARPLPCS